jgi:hypothetical protein
MEDLEWRKAFGVKMCNSSRDKSVEAWSLGPDRLQTLSGQELQGPTWSQARLDKSSRERLLLRHLWTACWCDWTHGALCYQTIVASEHCHLKTVVFYLKTCYDSLML